MRGRRTLATAAAVAAALAGRYVDGRRTASRETVHDLDLRLSDLGEVERLSIMPIVERHVGGPHLYGEPGVSYLVQADDLTLLFDTGLGSGRGRTPFDSNAETLTLSMDALDAVVISHLHADHVGGPRSQVRHTFALGREHQLAKGVAAFVPTDMTQLRADVCVVDQARVLGPGVAVLPPLPRMLFWLGLVAEQALVVNVRGRGLVLVTGCGHPEIERTLAAAEQVTDVPIYAVVGGLHLPVHATGTSLMPQAVLGNPNWPWRPINEADARAVMGHILERGPQLVALSGHDSTEWTLNAFSDVFGSRYRTLRVGEELVVTAS